MERIASAPVSVSVGAGASVQLAAANANRKGLRITVTGAANTLSLGFGAPAVANKGVVLSTSTGVPSYDMLPSTFFTGAVNGISGAGTITIAVQEWT